MTHLDHALQDLRAQRSCEEGLEWDSWEDEKDLPFRKRGMTSVEYKMWK